MKILMAIFTFSGFVAVLIGVVSLAAMLIGLLAQAVMAAFPYVLVGLIVAAIVMIIGVTSK